MTLGVHVNFAYTSVDTAPSPATSGTSLVVDDGSVFGSNFPIYAVVTAASQTAVGSNSEIVKITGISENTLTIEREQDGTDARTIVSGDRIYAGVLARDLTSIESSLGINVLWFGAAGDGVSDDTEAIQDAVDYAIANGVSDIHFPSGQYLITSAITIEWSGIQLIGAGLTATTIILGSETADGFVFGDGSSLYANCGIRDMLITTDQVRTAGSGIVFDNVSRCIIENIEMRDMFIGLLLTGDGDHEVDYLEYSSGIHISNIQIYGLAPDDGIGILIEGGGNHFIDKCHIFGNTGEDNPWGGGQPRAGIEVNGTIGTKINQCGISVSGIALNLLASGTFPGGDNRIIWNFNATDCWFDTSDYGCYVDAFAAGNSVYTMSFTGCWFSGHNENGLYITHHANGEVTGGTFTNCFFLYNNKYGVVLDKGKFIDFIGCHFAQNGVGGTGTWGAVVGGFVEHFKFIGCSFGYKQTFIGFDNNQTFGIVLVGNNDHYIIANNDFNIETNDMSVSTLGIYDNNTSVHKFVKNNINVNPFGKFLNGASQPDIPDSGDPVINTYGTDCFVYVVGGTVTDISVGGDSTGVTEGPVMVPAGSYIQITYSSAPTWTWFGV